MNPAQSFDMPLSRRQALAAGIASVSWVVAPGVLAQDNDMAAAVRRFTGGAVPGSGKVRLDIAPLVDNGNTVPLQVMVDSPMTAADHVTAIAVFNEKNPQTEVALFTLGPASGKAVVSTRIRLATSQKLVAVARLNNGSYWAQTVDVIVTLAACIEGDG